jgi:mRNA-degrading endonuclease RelE of RelBE toxin-antitoxin system
MIFVETRAFSRGRDVLLDEEEFRRLQRALATNAAAGLLIPGTGGLRKLRWAIGSRGKRGGVRIIYYWFPEQSRILLLLVYPKNVQDDLSAEQKQMLANVVEMELKGRKPR